ncbi:MAG: hypothetical protein EOP11_01200 [Proteobacteria bacterium]|nr:MAG: hypothetical protein EOP11_01200 [Pseudomonadota bacterium]
MALLNRSETFGAALTLVGEALRETKELRKHHGRERAYQLIQVQLLVLKFVLLGKSGRWKWLARLSLAYPRALLPGAGDAYCQKLFSLQKTINALRQERRQSYAEMPFPLA